MALTPDSTLIGQVAATIGSIDGDPERGPIDIAVVGGRVEISLGTLWATLTSDEVLDLARGLLIGEATARFIDLRRDLAHAREVLDEIELAG